MKCGQSSTWVPWLYAVLTGTLTSMLSTTEAIWLSSRNHLLLVAESVARPAPRSAPILGRHASSPSRSADCGDGRLDPPSRGRRPRRLREREPSGDLQR